MYRQLRPFAVAVLLVAAALQGQPASLAADPTAVTEPVSVDIEGQVAGAGGPAMSNDGTQVAFASRSALDPLIATGSGVSNIYVRDRRSPARTILISRGLPATSLAFSGGQNAAPEQGGNGDSLHASISATGRYVAFDTVATNLRDGQFRPGRRVVVCDRDPDGDGQFDETRPDGILDVGHLTLGAAAAGGPLATHPALSADATTIAWLEEPLPALAAIMPGARVVVTKLQRDAAGRLLAPDPGEFQRPLDTVPHATGSPDPPQVSGDGRQVVFTASTCAPGCPSPLTTIQAYDLAAHRATRLDLTPSGAFSDRARKPAVTTTGTRIAFEHSANVEGPPVAVVVDRDPAGGAPSSATTASRDGSGQPREGRSPALSPDGTTVAFVSTAAGMHHGTHTGRPAVITRDLVVDGRREDHGLARLPGELMAPHGDPGTAPRFSVDGSAAAFVSGDAPGAVFARLLRPRLVNGTGPLGRIVRGTSVTRTVNIAHHGFGPVRVRSIGIDGDDFALTGVDTCTGAVLRVADTCLVAVTVTPTAIGRRTAAMTVVLADDRVVSLELVAEGIEQPAIPPATEPSEGPAEPPGTPAEPPEEPAGQLDVTPAPLVFPGLSAALTWSAARTITVRNGTTGPVTISGVELVAGPGLHRDDFAVRHTTCPGVLAAGATCTIAVRTRPRGPGVRSGVVDVRTTDPLLRRLVPLSSRAAQPTIQPNPAVVRPNRVVAITGRGFPAGQRVRFELRPAGARVSTSAPADSNGVATAHLLVFPQTSPGTWPIVATTGPFQAQAPILVVPGTYQPPNFTGRR